jgi:DNA polymerase-1
VSLRSIHDFELALLDPILAMSERGILVDEALRQTMMTDLRESVAPLKDDLQAIVVPKLGTSIPKAHLFKPKREDNKPLKKTDLMALGADLLPEERMQKVVKKVLERWLRARGRYWAFNPGSDQQKQVVLYDLLKLPRRVTKGKLKVDEDTLKDLAAYDKSGVIQLLLQITKASTMLEIFERIRPGEDGRLRTFFNPAGTETGRFSSAESFLERSTNLQNMPKREALRDPRFNVRRCFIADPGCTFVEGDLSQAEARVVAALCRDDYLLERWQDPEFNVHKYTAAKIFGLNEADVRKESTEYVIGKMADHALNYGMGWQTFQRNVNADADSTGVSIDAATAKQVVRAYHQLRPRLKPWWKRVERQLADSGGLQTCFGRRRTFFGRRQADRWLDETHKEAIAFEPQSTVADLLNRGLLRFWQQHDPSEGELLLQVHDSVLLSTKSEKSSVGAESLQMCLEEEIVVNGVHLTIPAEVSAGQNWAEMEAI